ncbi:unnamed protein product [Pleuronectes platessa]|uniref:Uncharacterized protein n=1 Tax=Pleuronectes platessa TaxID=8262 RepID=A0A9N7UWK0_PLEPL|nr:unnamed protein product [Pleuronectes platessa]
MRLGRRRGESKVGCAEARHTSQGASKAAHRDQVDCRMRGACWVASRRGRAEGGGDEDREEVWPVGGQSGAPGCGPVTTRACAPHSQSNVTQEPKYQSKCSRYANGKGCLQ